MSTVRFRLWGLMRRFARAREGVAAVEFALILPFLALLYLGSVEVSLAITVDRRIASVAGAVGDLVARTNPVTEPLTTTKLNDYFAAAQLMMTPYSTTALRQVVTLVHVNNTGGTKVIWSKPYNGGVAHAKNATYPLPAAITNISKNNYVVVSEVSYTYPPTFAYAITQDFDLYKEFFHVARYGKEIKLD